MTKQESICGLAPRKSKRTSAKSAEKEREKKKDQKTQPTPKTRPKVSLQIRKKTERVMIQTEGKFKSST